MLNDASNSQVMHNEIWDMLHNGLSLWSGSDNNSVKMNEVADAGAFGIAVFGEGNIMRKNNVSGSGWLDLYDSSYPPGPLANEWVKNEYDTRNW